MNRYSSDTRLDALLRDMPPVPPAAAGLAARILSAAAATPQERQPSRPARIAIRRDRRGKWLRRPLLAGTAALGLLVTSAVAATLAGVPIPQKIAAVFFPAEKAAEPKAEPARRRAERTPPRRAAPVETAGAAQGEPAVDAIRRPEARPWRNLLRAQRIVAARRAMGLPTPGADRLERQLRRRALLWRNATPAQRARWLQRQRERRQARQAGLSGNQSLERPPGPRLGRRLTWQERAERREALRQWRADRQAAGGPTQAQREMRRERLRQWREQRRARQTLPRQGR